MQKSVWQEKHTSGSPPLGVCACGFAVVGKKVVTYGGYCGHDYCWHNSLHELDTTTLQWKELAPSDAEGAPMKKSDCGVVVYSRDGKKQLYVLGGFGDLQTATFQPGAEYVNLAKYPDYACTNELHCFVSGDC